MGREVEELRECAHKPIPPNNQTPNQTTNLGEERARVGARAERVHEREEHVAAVRLAHVLDLFEWFFVFLLVVESVLFECLKAAVGGARAMTVDGTHMHTAARPKQQRTIYLLGDEREKGLAVLDLEQALGLLQAHARAEAAVELEHRRRAQQRLFV